MEIQWDNIGEEYHHLKSTESAEVCKQNTFQF